MHAETVESLKLYVQKIFYNTGARSIHIFNSPIWDIMPTTKPATNNVLDRIVYIITFIFLLGITLCVLWHNILYLLIPEKIYWQGKRLS